MSHFTDAAINPATGRLELATFVDNFYGPHKYGVRFADGGVYPEEKVAIAPNQKVFRGGPTPTAPEPAPAS